MTDLLVHQLDDGRCFIADQTVVEVPELNAILARMSNYWTRHEWLDGWATPVPDSD